MRLLITTQAVDKDDPILGFFHGWLLELSNHVEHIHVICLREEIHELPGNVSVYSLGKEKGVNYARYLWRLSAYVWKLRNAHDVVFSHMNPHYIVLAGWFWFLKGKRMYFWRNHAKMNFMTRIVAKFARRVFYTSPFACTSVFPHSKQMPVGINTEMFQPQVGILRKGHSVLFLGRISTVKRPELFVKAGQFLPDYEMHVYGDESVDARGYLKKLGALSSKNVHFHNAVPNYETPNIYSAFDVYINLTPEGSMDKTVLEAAACGALVLAANKSFEGLVPQECVLRESTPEGIAKQIRVLCEMPAEKKDEYRALLGRMVEEHHSLKKLVAELVTQFRAW